MINENLVVLCKDKNYDCQVIPLQDVKKVEKITSGEVLRVTFSYGGLLDIKILGKTFEIKKKKYGSHTNKTIRRRHHRTENIL